ncbi:cell division suppressor protein YneA [Listeria grandensis]|uniref:Cell division suppressor protein YneA n=1 Tax=Listeria grandensis TaxID=1494963 RepID=A0A7X1CNP5_9LIST|nr:cell division suppressor protein YneA [Listeria grandensis]MBC1473170.1 cell division suppressor protein YneA [Listeria grandensis]MBC1935126.1 cell division suppressor protein YneA [Listeria grandensis]MBC6314677.1 cell division suppressor protein YneA [Listeria grandensis]
MTLKTIWDRYYIAIIFIITCFVLGAVLLIVTVNQAESDYNEVSVASGDSIWGLADEYAGKYKMSKQEFVAWVEKENQIIDGKLTAGEMVTIPVKRMNSDIDSSIQLADK